MTIFWQKGAGGKVTDTVPPSQVSEMHPLHTHLEGQSAHRFGAALARESAPTQPLFHLERELATADNTQEAIYALLRTLDALLEPALVCVVLAGTTEGAEEGCLFARFGGRSTAQPIPAGAMRASALSMSQQAGWKSLIGDLWAAPHGAAQYLGRKAVFLPFKAEERSIGATLIWPHGRQAWPLEDLQGAYLALSLTALTIQRLLLRGNIEALQQQMVECRSQALEAQQRAGRCERLACIGQTISSVAHELNNPLTTVIGHAQMLQEAEVQGPASASLRMISEQAQHCRQIVQNLLGVVRSSPASCGPIMLEQVIQNTIQLMARTLEIDGIEAIVSIEPEMPGVLANPHHLQQVLVNLIRNAQEAMVHAGQGSTVRVAARVVEHEGRPAAQVTIEDDGPGVPEEIRARLFEPYFTTKQEQGTGLGLPVSRQLVLDMGGDLWLDGMGSRGARFVIRLPMAMAKTAGGEPVVQAPQDEGATAELRCGRTLIVEDDENLADLVERALAGAGQSVTRAANGDEALRQIAQQDFDLILLDLRMPKRGGERTYQSLQNRYPHLLSRLVFTTGDGANAETRRWLESTGCPVLEKPFDLGQLRHLAGQFLRPAS